MLKVPCLNPNLFIVTFLFIYQILYLCISIKSFSSTYYIYKHISCLSGYARDVSKRVESNSYGGD